MRLKRADSVYDVAYPIYIISRIVGYLPFTIVCDDSSRSLQKSSIKITLFDCVWILVWVSLLIAFMVINGVFDFQSQVSDSSIVNICNRMVVWGGYLFGILTIIMDIINRKRIWKIVVMFAVFDEQVSNTVYSPKMQWTLYITQSMHCCRYIYWGQSKLISIDFDWMCFAGMRALQ